MEIDFERLKRLQALSEAELKKKFGEEDGKKITMFHDYRNFFSTMLGLAERLDDPTNKTKDQTKKTFWQQLERRNDQWNYGFLPKLQEHLGEKEYSELDEDLKNKIEAKIEEANLAYEKIKKRKTRTGRDMSEIIRILTEMNSLFKTQE